MWEETGEPGGNPRLSTEQSVDNSILFTCNQMSKHRIRTLDPRGGRQSLWTKECERVVLDADTLPLILADNFCGMESYIGNLQEEIILLGYRHKKVT